MELFHLEVVIIVYYKLGLTEKELYSKISKGLFIIPEFVSNEAKNLIQKMLIVNPNNRIDSQSVNFIFFNIC